MPIPPSSKHTETGRDESAKETVSARRTPSVTEKRAAQLQEQPADGRKKDSVTFRKDPADKEKRREKKRVKRGNKARRNAEIIEYREYHLSFAEWIRYGLTGILFAAVIAYVFYRNWFAFFLFLPLAVIYPLTRRKPLQKKRVEKLTTEFRESITILSSYLAAGYSLENAMRECEGELRLLYGPKSMMVRELELMNHKVRMNVPAEQAWEEFAERSDVEDIRNFAQVIKVAKRSGGELNSMIARTADTIGDKIRIKEDIKTITSAKRLEQTIMNLVPIFIVIYIDVTSPGFFDPLYTGVVGRVIMTACLFVYLLAIYLSGRILSIEI